MNGKFKVWDKIRRRWSDRNFAILMSGQLMIWDTNMSWSNDQINERFIPVFSTCLTDKNGDDIYEGDIVDCYWNRPFLVKHKIEKGTDTIGHGSYSDYIFSGYRFNYDKIEIIGNKFENPELLKTK